MFALFQGHVEALSSVQLTVRYLPAGPRPFHASFQIEVAHFAPDTVNLYGEAVFPRIYLNLARSIDPRDLYKKLSLSGGESVGVVDGMNKRKNENEFLSHFDSVNAFLQVEDC